MKNIPYVKIFKGDVLTNPITKDKPYRSLPQRQSVNNTSNNSKGGGILVVNLGKGVFVRYRSYKQLIPKANGKNKVITHYVDVNERLNASKK